MKKQILIILCATILLSTCISCTKTNTDIQQVKDVPEMQLEYTLDIETYKVSVSSGTSSWRFDNGDGTFTGGEADAPHPLDMIGHMPEIKKVDGLKEIVINFTLQPDSYIVRRWSDKYIGEVQEHEEDYESVEVSDNIIVLSDDGIGYVYAVYATWLQGNASYAFYITNP